MPHEESQFINRLIGHERCLCIASKNCSCDQYAVEWIGFCFANSFVSAIAGLYWIQHDTGIAATLKFIVQSTPVLSGRFHCNQWLTSIGGRLQDLPFQKIDPRLIVLERLQGCNDFTLRSDGSCSVLSFADVDADDVSMIDFHSIGFDFTFLFFHFYLRNSCGEEKWFESVTSMVMQSVPTQRSTNRLIRGNRTGVHKRHGSYSVNQDRNQGEIARLPVSRSFRLGNGFEDTCEYRLKIGIDAGLRFYRRNRQELVCAVRITGIPRTKREESFFDKFVACIPKLVPMKHGHGSFDDVESPAGESVLVGDKREEEVESELFGFEVSDPLFGSQSMVKPREGSRNLSDDIRYDGHELFFKRHDWFSKLLLMCDVGDITRCMENRHAAFDGLRKSKKLESFQLSKLSYLRSLGNPTQSKQSPIFTQIAKTEVDSNKKIQQIHKFRRKEDSKTPSFTILY